MYLSFYGLNKCPFSMTPDPKTLFLTVQHREAVAGLAYAILNRKGFLVLSGEVGTGKSTVLARILNILPPGRVRASMVRHPTLQPDEFLEMLLLDFGISEIPSSKAQRLLLLQKLLLDIQAKNQIAALVIDEAHKLSHDLLEEIRLLGNFDTPDQKLLQIVLAGQSELDDVLAREGLRQLKQRVAVRLTLQALNESEIESYIRFRWTHAGGKPEHPFRQETVAAIYRWSGGIPRLINSISDNALMLAFSEQAALVEARHVQQAVEDLDLAHNAASRLVLKPALPAPAAPPVAQVAPPSRTRKEEPEPAPAPVTGKIPEIRVPRVYEQEKPSFVNRWAAKLGLA